MKTRLTILLLAGCSVPGFSQNGFHEVSQRTPELCGKTGGTVPLPNGFSATFGNSGGPTISVRNGAPAIPLKYPLYQIEEVCPLSGGRLVVFGEVVGNGSSFHIVDTASTSLLDTVLTLYPSTSPDQRWIVYNKFVPRSTELPPSSEYLLYYLSKSPVQNRAPGVSLDDTVDVGAPIYPSGWKNESGDNIGAPTNQRHSHLPGGEAGFFWAPDSKAIVFADSHLGKSYIVLITLDEKDATTASVYPFADTMDCADTSATARGMQAEQTRLGHVEFGPQQGADRILFVDFQARGCNPKAIQLHRDSFQPSKSEARVLETPARKALKAGSQPTR